MSSFKINTGTELPSEQYVLQNKRGFDKVLTKFKGFKPTMIQKTWFFGGSAAVLTTVAVLTTLLVFKPAMKDNNNQGNENAAVAQKFVAAPIRQLDIPYEKFTIDNSKQNVVTARSGSKIVIPQNTFADSKGNPVSGMTQIRYREFHDVADLFRCGVPMTYDSAGNKYTFESAGMFEILAYKDAEPLEIAKNKNIDISMVTYNDDPKFNFYYLDTTNKNWVYLEKSFFTVNAGNSTSDQPKQDLASNDRKETKRDMQKNNYVKPVQAGKSKYAFKVDFDNKEFPELAIYKNPLFEVAEEKSTFSPSLYAVNWDKIRLKKSKLDGLYILSLSRPDTSIKVYMRPVFAKDDYQKAIETYNQGQQQKTKENAQKKAKSDVMVKDRDAYNTLANPTDRSQSVPVGTRNMSIGRLGYYNHDCSMPPYENYSFSPVFKEDGKVIIPKNIYTADIAINALKQTSGAVGEIKCNKESSNIMWITTDDNRIAVINTAEFAEAIRGTKNPVFNVKLTDAYTALKTVHHLMTGEVEADIPEPDKNTATGTDNSYTIKAPPEAQISCYPNPAKESLNVEIKDNTDFSKTTIRIYNSEGAKVKEIIPSNTEEKQTIDISTWTTGVYFIRLENPETGTKTVKFIKE